MDMDNFHINKYTFLFLEMHFLKAYTCSPSLSLAFSPRYKLAPQVYPTPVQHLASTWSPPLRMPPGSLSDTHCPSNYFNDYVKT
ncbi:hypothetical protein DY000_02053291 [Brassica cretica]|uniref:Uncharacterized protein n=1 Tax=Brassica cretica TaxID=69181 RepID=A0ABQ7AIJ2_BRACR|nr:hypothetical protein DY000_02053291 [Brassica cretica]